MLNGFDMSFAMPAGIFCFSSEVFEVGSGSGMSCSHPIEQWVVVVYWYSDCLVSANFDRNIPISQRSAIGVVAEVTLFDVQLDIFCESGLFYFPQFEFV